MKILIIQQRYGIGDMVIFLPYIHAISKKFNTKISLLAKETSRAKQIMGEDDCIDEIITLNSERDGLRGIFKLSHELKSKSYDKVFIFNSSLRYYLVAKLSGIKSIYQYPLFRSKDNIVHSAKIFTENITGNIVSTEPNLKIKSTIDNFNSEFKHICLGISASGPTKRWDINNYIKLCQELSKYKKCKFYIAGGKNDIELINEFKKSEIGKNCQSFENLSIKQILPIIKNCDCYIGSDTGFAHLSVALGIKALTLFMDSPVMAYGKYSNRMHVIEPEGEKNTTSHDTLGSKRISFEKTLLKAKEIIN
tara:strand:- start:461 stop:1381 length:921 start_codon:yes stop_codon:yes gene_type:complete